MKRARLEKTFIEELERTANISVACEKAGLARQTVYRWKKEDEKFRLKVDDALDMGVESVCDLAESKMITNINNGNQRAIEFYLSSNKKAYFKPRPKIEHNYRGIKSITYEVVDKFTPESPKDSPDD